MKNEGKNSDKPKNVFMWFEPKCNLQCKHCNIWKNEDSKKALSLRERKKIIDDLYSWLGKDFTLNLLGGEPFLHSDIIDIVSYANNKGIITTLTTNGTLINDDLAEEITNSGLTYLNFSIDSISHEQHDRIRGVKGTHERALEGIRSLENSKESLPNILINTIIHKGNLNYLKPLTALVEDKGLFGITFQPIAPKHLFGGRHSNKIVEKLLPFFENMRSKFQVDLLDKIYLKKSEKWYQESDFWPKYKEVKPILEVLLDLKEKGKPIKNSKTDLIKFHDYFRDPLEFSKNYKCTSGNRLTVTKNGKFKLCTNKIDIGDYKKDSAAEVWENKKSKRVREEIINCNRTCKIICINKKDFYF